MAGARSGSLRALRGVVLALLVVGLASWLFAAGGLQRLAEALPGRQPRLVEVGTVAPDFRAHRLDGAEIGLGELRGKVVLLNFWATWCTPCRAELPMLEEIYERHRERGLVVLGIDVQEDAETIKEFLPQVGVTFPILLDSDSSLAIRYRATGLPANFLIDRQGTLRDIRLGAYTHEMLEARLEPLL